MNEARRYKVLETLGRGGFGTVYRAELLGAGGFTKQVALKILNDEGQREIAHRLRDEARILGLLQHRAVVGVDNLVRLEPGWAVVMEYVAGVDATSLIRYGPPPVRAVLEIVEEVASALHAAYAQSSEMTGRPLYLIHRDIKPSNIRITPRGEVKILDFGVAQASFKTREARTRATLFGSFQYMAPERLDGIDGPKGDIYALGLVMARLLTGARFPEPPKHPRRHTTFTELIAQRVKEGLADATSQASPEAQEAILGLVSSMISFEPTDRPSARDVERFCREWRSPLFGPWLRDWAEHEVPKLASRVAPPQVEEALTGSILVELAGEDALPAALPHEDETSETVAIGPWEVAALDLVAEESRAPRLPSPRVETFRIPEPRPVEAPKPEPEAASAAPETPPAADIPAEDLPVVEPAARAAIREAAPVRIEQRRGGGFGSPPDLDAIPRSSAAATLGMVLPDIEDDEAPTAFMPGARPTRPPPPRPVEPEPPRPAQAESPIRAARPAEPPPTDIPSPGLPPASLFAPRPAVEPAPEVAPPPDLLDALDVPEAPALAKHHGPELPDVNTALFSVDQALLQAALAQTGRAPSAALTEQPTAEVPTVAVPRASIADEEASTIELSGEIETSVTEAQPTEQLGAATLERIAAHGAPEPAVVPAPLPSSPAPEPPEPALGPLPEVDLAPPVHAPRRVERAAPIAPVADAPPSRTRIEAPVPPPGTVRTVKPATPATPAPAPAASSGGNRGLVAGVAAVVVVAIIALVVPRSSTKEGPAQPAAPAATSTAAEQAPAVAPAVEASPVSAAPATTAAPAAPATTATTAAPEATAPPATTTAPAPAATAAPAATSTAAKPAAKPTTSSSAAKPASSASSARTREVSDVEDEVYPPPLTVIRSGSSSTTSAPTPAPAPTPTPTPAPEPAPAAASAGGNGTVRVTGEASQVWLVSASGQRLAPGSVPAGTYSLKATFADGAEVAAGRVEVQAGQDVTLKCIGAFRQCRKQ